jgi:hypothetical protein
MLRLFRVYVSTRVAALLASEFILIYACYLAATLTWLRADVEVFLVDDQGWLRILIVVLCLLLSIYFHDLYSNLGTRPKRIAATSGRGSGDCVLN